MIPYQGNDVSALREIAKELGKNDWNFSVDPCSKHPSWNSQSILGRPYYVNQITCDCPGYVCHVDNISLKGQDLAGVLPKSLVNLHYLKVIDLTRNYLTGTIPREWASMKLEYLSVIVNRLSGPIPAYLGDFKNLTYISLESNQFYGTVPAELGKLVNLQSLTLSTNNLTGQLSKELMNLTELTELRLSSNNFSGKIPDYFHSWKNLQKLEIMGSGFEGPIPVSISGLTNSTELRISDLTGAGSTFPSLSNMSQMTKLVLRNCGLFGSVPSSIADDMPLIKILIKTISTSLGCFLEHHFTLILWAACGCSGIVHYCVHKDKPPSPQCRTGCYRNRLLRNLVLQVFNYQFLMHLYKAHGKSRTVQCDASKPKGPHVRDLSFNKLEGPIPDNLAKLTKLENLYLTSNFLSGSVPGWITASGITIDLSYNNLNISSVPTSCKADNVNYFKSSSRNSSSSLVECQESFHCSKAKYSLHINCGGNQVVIGKITFEADGDNGGPAKFVPKKAEWGFSSTGDFWNLKLGATYIAKNSSILTMTDSALYADARLGATSLTYYGRCLGTGNYSVTLYFAELIFTDSNSFQSLGVRIFDVYIQEKLVLKDFDVRKEAKGSNKAINIPFTHIPVKDTIQIRFYFAGKGTTAVPVRGIYGPLVSAISVESGCFFFFGELDSKEPSCYEDARGVEEWEAAMKEEFDAQLRNDTWELVPRSNNIRPVTCKWVYKVKRKSDGSVDSTQRLEAMAALKNAFHYGELDEFTPPVDREKVAKIAGGVVASFLVLVFVVIIIIWRRHRSDDRVNREIILKGLDLKTGSFTLRQLKAATDNFHPDNKIGEGGFGSVFKGTLLDCSHIAVKHLFARSSQANRQFVNEIGIISGLNHPNLVRFYGCCAEGNELLLVYEYMANNHLGHALFGPDDGRLKLDWATRRKISIGIARGLVFLHEESPIKIVHRDIKVANILLDGELNAKIADFGLARLDEEDKTHISTRIAGTIGYMAPEYVLWGYLTFKADVYSFGVVLLEIVAGRCNMKFRPDENHFCLLDWAMWLRQKGDLMDLVDPRLSSDYNKEEALRMIKIALLCTDPSPALRPSMSAVVSMLQGDLSVHATTGEEGTAYTTSEWMFEASRRQHDHTDLEIMRETRSLLCSESNEATSISRSEDHP
ncbi:putative LRR receptor-like serine/threonine-protein kinase [Drosera capensis]